MSTLVPESTATIDRPLDDKLLATVTEYWMKARIDAPIRAAERLDGNAKQMIVLAGTLQGVILAVVKLAGDPDWRMVVLAGTGVGLLLLSIMFSAALLGKNQDYVGADPVMSLLRERDPAVKLEMLAEQLGEMCRELKKLLPAKQKLMTAAFVCFAFSIITSIGCLLVWFDVHRT